MIKKSCFSTIVEEVERNRKFDRNKGDRFIGKCLNTYSGFSTYNIPSDSSNVKPNLSVPLHTYATTSSSVLCGYTSTAISFDRVIMNSDISIGEVGNKKGIKNTDLPSNTKGLNNGRNEQI